MSADNLVRAFRFKKADGTTVWRVAELSLSDLQWELCAIASTDASERRFLEFSGPLAEQSATRAAYDIERRLGICEYGVEVDGPGDKVQTMSSLQQSAIAAGYPADAIYALREAPDAHWVGRYAVWGDLENGPTKAS